MQFGFGEVIRLSGATRSQLIHWTDKLLVKASVQEATGRGGWRQFSEEDILLVMAAVELTGRFSFPLRPLKAALAAVDEAARTDRQVVFLSWVPSAQPRRRTDSRDADIDRSPSAVSGENWFWIGSYLDLAAKFQAIAEQEKSAPRLTSTGIVVDVGSLRAELESRLSGR